MYCNKKFFNEFSRRDTNHQAWSTESPQSIFELTILSKNVPNIIQFFRTLPVPWFKKKNICEKRIRRGSYRIKYDLLFEEWLTGLSKQHRLHDIKNDFLNIAF